MEFLKGVSLGQSLIKLPLENVTLMVMAVSFIFYQRLQREAHTFFFLIRKETKVIVFVPKLLKNRLANHNINLGPPLPSQPSAGLPPPHAKRVGAAILVVNEAC